MEMQNHADSTGKFAVDDITMGQPILAMVKALHLGSAMVQKYAVCQPAYTVSQKTVGHIFTKKSANVDNFHNFLTVKFRMVWYTRV